MANGNDVDITQINDQLRRLAMQNKRVKDDALKAGAEKVRQALERNTPKSVRGKNHLADNTTMTGINRDGEIAIGYKKKVKHRVHFAELGTVYQRPQHFIQDTEQEISNEFFRTVENELRRGLGL